MWTSTFRKRTQTMRNPLETDSEESERRPFSSATRSSSSRSESRLYNYGRTRQHDPDEEHRHSQQQQAAAAASKLFSPSPAHSHKSKKKNYLLPYAPVDDAVEFPWNAKPQPDSDSDDAHDQWNERSGRSLPGLQLIMTPSLPFLKANEASEVTEEPPVIEVVANEAPANEGRARGAQANEALVNVAPALPPHVGIAIRELEDDDYDALLLNPEEFLGLA